MNESIPWPLVKNKVELVTVSNRGTNSLGDEVPLRHSVLENQINEYLAEGYVLHGGPTHLFYAGESKITIVQTMIRWKA